VRRRASERSPAAPCCDGFGPWIRRRSLAGASAPSTRARRSAPHPERSSSTMPSKSCRSIIPRSICTSWTKSTVDRSADPGSRWRPMCPPAWSGGFYLTLDEPSEVSVALCLAHAVLPKEAWLLERKIQAEWPDLGRSPVRPRRQWLGFQRGGAASRLRRLRDSPRVSTARPRAFRRTHRTADWHAHAAGAYPSRYHVFQSLGARRLPLGEGRLPDLEGTRVLVDARDLRALPRRHPPDAGYLAPGGLGEGGTARYSAVAAPRSAAVLHWIPARRRSHAAAYRRATGKHPLLVRRLAGDCALQGHRERALRPSEHVADLRPRLPEPHVHRCAVCRYPLPAGEPV
jgi:hypothetical protein